MKIIPLEEDSGIRNIIKLALVFWAAEIILIGGAWSFLPYQVPLFYSQPWGQEQLAAPVNLFLLPLLGLLIFFLNSLIFSFIPKDEKLIKKILMTTFLVFNFLSLVTLTQIIRLMI